MVADSPCLLNDQVKIYEDPFAHQLHNNLIGAYCSHCLRVPETKLLKCAACQHCMYCDVQCQKEAWSQHRAECRRLKAVFPNLPLTEVLFLSKAIDRVQFIKEKGDVYGWEKERTFESLISHSQEIKKDKPKMEHFEKIFKKMETFRGSEMVSYDEMFEVFCRVSINSHSIHSNGGIEIGMAIDLGVSKYNHSCRPTVAMVFDGIRVYLRPLVPSISLDDYDKAFISYIDVGRSRYRRRLDLKNKWYFDCQCERCEDPEEKRLTAIKCSTPGCDEPLLTSEDDDPMNIACPSCHAVVDEDTVQEAIQLMKELPASFDPHCPPETIEELLAKASKLLHPRNVYITRLQTALLHIKGELEGQLPTIHKDIYNNYKLCFPKTDRHVGFSLLNIVKSLIQKGKRKEAVLYAYEAMTIFEVCLGLEHPFYLQTLALWTYLDKDIPKTTDELLALTKYGDNKPVDISSLLQQLL